MDNKLLQFIKSKYSNQKYTSGSLLRESSDNKVYILNGKLKHILRISKRDINTDIQFEIKLLDMLSDKNFTSPEIIPTDKGEKYLVYEGKVLIITTFISGVTVDFTVDNKPSKEYVISAAKMLAKLHEITTKNTISIEKSRNIYTELERVKNFKDVFENEIKGGIEFVQEVREYLIWARLQKDEEIIIHNDYRPHNILFNPENKTVSAVLDYDWACKGPFIKDLAQATVEWSFPDKAKSPWEDLFSLFIETYKSERKIHLDFKLLRKWIAYSCLSDTATFFCDRVNDPNFRKDITSSYMYSKFKYFHNDEE